MPQAIALALVGGALWYGYRAFKREMTRVSKETQKAEKRISKATSLKKGEDGVYRPDGDQTDG